MLNDDELGIALSEELRALVIEVEPSQRLVDRVGQIGESRSYTLGLARRRRPRDRMAAAMSIPITVLVAALIFLLGGSEVTPSFAVVEKRDGDVFVTINDLSGVVGANARLRQLGVQAVVVPMTVGCPDQPDLTYLGVDTQAVRLTRTLPANTRILLAARQLGPNKVEMAFGRVRGTPPSCVSVEGAGSGLSGWSGVDRAQTNSAAARNRSERRGR